MKIILAVVILLLLSSIPAQAESVEFNLDSLLQASVGGPDAVDSLRVAPSYYATGSASLNGMPGRFLQVFAPPDKTFLEVDLGGFTITQAFDGTTGWQMDHNGNVTELSGYELDELLKNLYFDSYSYLFPNRVPGSRAYIGQTEIDGSPVHQVEFYPLDKDTVTVFFETSKGHRRLMISEMDNITTRTTIDDHRIVDGVLLPFTTKAEAPEVPLTIEMWADTVALDRYPAPDRFTMPGSLAADFPAGVDSVIIPMTFRSGHIHLKATLNGKLTANFILDSGASSNLLHQPTVAELDLPVIGALPARGVAGFEQVDLVRTESFEIGKLTLHDLVAGSIDLSGLGRHFRDTDFGGLLGYDFISRFPLMIDYTAQRLVVYNPAAFEPDTSTAVVIPFELTMMVPTIEATLLGQTGRFVVDLGNAFGLVVHPSFASDHDLESRMTALVAADRFGGGIGGSISGRTGLADEFTFGDITLQELRVYLPDGGSGIVDSENLAGNIGNLLLQNFRVLFDYANRRILLFEA